MSNCPMSCFRCGVFHANIVTSCSACDHDRQSYRPNGRVSVKRERGEGSSGGVQKRRTQDPEEILTRQYNLDPETLNCTICMEPLNSPVFQCQNGHIACSGCCPKLTGGCPSCRMPIGRIRCLAVEKILDSLQVSCKYAALGCNQMLKPSKREKHETTLCMHLPFLCPVPHCFYHGSRLEFPQHFFERHGTATVLLTPLMRAEFTMGFDTSHVMVKAHQGLFLIHHEVEAYGDVFFCTTFGEYTKKYNLKVEIPEEQRFHVMETMASDIRVQDDWKKDFLVVPERGGASDNQSFDIVFWLPSEHIDLDV